MRCRFPVKKFIELSLGKIRYLVYYVNKQRLIQNFPKIDRHLFALVETQRKVKKMTAAAATPFQNPPVLTNSSGQIRKVGFELELSGVDLPLIAETISDLFGGKVHPESPFSHKISGTEFGDFAVEVDAALLKDRRYQEFLNSIGIELDADDQEILEKFMLDAAAIAVPFEIVFPPIPVTALEKLRPLELALKKMPAKGTRASVLYAFGMQFNPEIPCLDAQTILAYLRAFFVLFEWLRKEMNTDLSRRILPFIDDFPDAYVRRVLTPEYAPNFQHLAREYITFNPTRNRPLDLLPLFAHVDASTITSKIKESHLVKPRPTFHYRLPDCRIDEPDWSMALEWNRWVKVEQLAGDPPTLTELSKERLERKPGLPGWMERLVQWVNP